MWQRVTWYSYDLGTLLFRMNFFHFFSNCKWLYVREFRWNKHEKTNQHYAQNNSYIEPDFVVALDCGFKFYLSWKKSIPHIVRPRCATLIFTEFIEKDCQDNWTFCKMKMAVEICKLSTHPKEIHFKVWDLCDAATKVEIMSHIRLFTQMILSLLFVIQGFRLLSNNICDKGLPDIPMI